MEDEKYIPLLHSVSLTLLIFFSNSLPEQRRNLLLFKVTSHGGLFDLLKLSGNYIMVD